jgi:hypothetical protein
LRATEKKQNGSLRPSVFLRGPLWLQIYLPLIVLFNFGHNQQAGEIFNLINIKNQLVELCVIGNPSMETIYDLENDRVTDLFID